jgi:hypothetical protein
MTDNAIITSAQNAVVAINGLQKTYAQAYGTANSTTYSGGTTTIIVTGTGRVNNISITVSAAAVTTIYDSATTSAISASNVLAVIPASTAVGTITLNKVYTSGIVLVTGAGVSANITYSPF